MKSAGFPSRSEPAAFMYLSALFHFVIAAPGGFGFYSSELRRGRNRLRWVEYSLSASLMIVLIALITGITDNRCTDRGSRSSMHR